MDSNGTVYQVKSVINMGCFNLFQQLKGFQGAMIKVMKCVQNIHSQIMDVQMCISFFFSSSKTKHSNYFTLYLYYLYCKTQQLLKRCFTEYFLTRKRMK